MTSRKGTAPPQSAPAVSAPAKAQQQPQQQQQQQQPTKAQPAPAKAQPAPQPAAPAKAQAQPVGVRQQPLVTRPVASATKAAPMVQTPTPAPVVQKPAAKAPAAQTVAPKVAVPPPFPSPTKPPAVPAKPLVAPAIKAAAAAAGRAAPAAAPAAPQAAAPSPAPQEQAPVPQATGRKQTGWQRQKSQAPRHQPKEAAPQAAAPLVQATLQKAPAAAQEAAQTALAPTPSPALKRAPGRPRKAAAQEPQQEARDNQAAEAKAEALKVGTGEAPVLKVGAVGAPAEVKLVAPPHPTQAPLYVHHLSDAEGAQVAAAQAAQGVPPGSLMARVGDDVVPVVRRGLPAIGVEEVPTFGAKPTALAPKTHQPLCAYSAHVRNVDSEEAIDRAAAALGAEDLSVLRQVDRMRRLGGHNRTLCATDDAAVNRLATAGLIVVLPWNAPKPPQPACYAELTPAGTAVLQRLGPQPAKEAQREEAQTVATLQRYAQPPRLPGNRPAKPAK